MTRTVDPKYLEEYEKYKHIVLDPGLYQARDNFRIQYELISIDYKSEKVTLKTLHSENIHTKTLHWCRKNLKRVV